MREIPLTKGKVTLVDDEDFEYLSEFRWCCSSSGYAIRNAQQINKKRYPQISMHREIINAPKGMEVDHINGNKLDNRKENLRIVTRTQNMWNRSKLEENKSGYKGVSPSGKGYVAELMVNGERVLRKHCKTLEEAVQAYKEAAVTYHKEYARFDDVTVKN